MNGRRIVVTPSAYAYPLLIKQLLHAPLMQAPKQEIVYRDARWLRSVFDLVTRSECWTGTATDFSRPFSRSR